MEQGSEDRVPPAACVEPTEVSTVEHPSGHGEGALVGVDVLEFRVVQAFEIVGKLHVYRRLPSESSGDHMRAGTF